VCTRAMDGQVCLQVGEEDAERSGLNMLSVCQLASMGWR
jgi:hypothetical protein